MVGVVVVELVVRWLVGWFVGLPGFRWEAGRKRNGAAPHDRGDGPWFGLAVLVGGDRLRRRPARVAGLTVHRVRAGCFHAVAAGRMGMTTQKTPSARRATTGLRASVIHSTGAISSASAR